MAVSRATVVQSLSIALIVFVMLTFVLAVTTYLFFTQTIRLEDEAKIAREDMAKANAAQTVAEADRDALKAAIGIAEGEEGTGDEIRAKLGEDFADISWDFCKALTLLVSPDGPAGAEVAPAVGIDVDPTGGQAYYLNAKVGRAIDELGRILTPERAVPQW